MKALNTEKSTGNLDNRVSNRDYGLRVVSFVGEHFLRMYGVFRKIDERVYIPCPMWGSRNLGFCHRCRV